MVQDIEADSNDVFSIPFWKESDGSSKTSLGLAQFCSSLGRSVLSHDDTVLGSTRLLKSAQRSQRTRIIDSADHDMSGMRRSQMFSHGLKAGAEFSIPVQIRHPAMRGARKHEVDAYQQS